MFKPHFLHLSLLTCLSVLSIFHPVSATEITNQSCHSIDAETPNGRICCFDNADSACEEPPLDCLPDWNLSRVHGIRLSSKDNSQDGCWGCCRPVAGMREKREIQVPQPYHAPHSQLHKEEVKVQRVRTLVKHSESSVERRHVVTPKWRVVTATEVVLDGAVVTEVGSRQLLFETSTNGRCNVLGGSKNGYIPKKDVSLIDFWGGRCVDPGFRYNSMLVQRSNEIAGASSDSGAIEVDSNEGVSKVENVIVEINIDDVGPDFESRFGKDVGDEIKAAEAKDIEGF
ncbi:hypothetical protein BJ508DRAFT_327859 [Ascobolus immersus RN42]|uniref:Uncharacterized protein n=1 Tax=Ascobolus immersus RN42 TaxID=1160509 RepID=A0A3N4I1M2_ASCIM|nr:hypothetical protein BJ508DRAFT_327859 [Ascobolus immersus RN42]